jgi:hypothetical protein
LRPVFELVLAHYHSRCGLQTPAVERAVQQLRPEGAGPGADQAGFGTLLYAGVTTEQASAGHLVAPAALHAEKSDAAIALRWAAVRGARAYSVERAESNGKFRSIQANIAEDNFRDSTVETTKQYSYRLRAHGNSFSSEPSQATHIYAGLPAPWKELRLGNSDGTSGAQYDGSVLTLKSAGSGILTPGDDGLCVYVASACNHLRARFLPQVASQSAIFGLMHRQGASPFAPCIGLLLSSESGDIEHHGWCLRMVTRSEQMVLQTIATQPLASPIVQFGRLMRPVWFRLDAVGAYIQARFSFDGDAWNLLGRAPFSRVGQLAIVASSGIATVDTSVRFDSILFSSVG